MEALMPGTALRTDNPALRSATDEAETGQLRGALHQGHYLNQDISPFPGARQFVRSTREWFERNSPEIKSETRHFITSLDREEKSAVQLATAIRGHWSVENKNHWKSDTCLWREDASRPRKRARGGQVLALLRGAVLRLHDLESFE